MPLDPPRPIIPGTLAAYILSPQYTIVSQTHLNKSTDTLVKPIHDKQTVGLHMCNVAELWPRMIFYITILHRQNLSVNGRVAWRVCVCVCVEHVSASLYWWTRASHHHTCKNNPQPNNIFLPCSGSGVHTTPAPHFSLTLTLHTNVHAAPHSRLHLIGGHHHTAPSPLSLWWWWWVLWGCGTHILIIPRPLAAPPPSLCTYTSLTRAFFPIIVMVMRYNYLLRCISIILKRLT